MASWCQPCKTLTQRLAQRGLVLPEFDIDNPDVKPLLERFGVRSVPTIVVEETDGTYKAITGAMLTQDTVEILKAYSAG